MKINKRIEDIFAHACALTQNGRLKSTIYCHGKKIYILNQDQTVLLRFLLRKNEGEFKEQVSFNANDYDSNVVDVQKGEIQFIQEGAGFIRVKSCKTPAMTPSKVNKMFKGFELDKVNKVHLHKDILSLLDPKLSHVEFSAKDGKLQIVQRNIYSGAVIRMSRKEAKGLGMEVQDEIEDFKPLALRTGDFMALFSFVDSFLFYFMLDGLVWADSVGSKMFMRALLGQCRYDELGGVSSGRKIKKVGRSK